MEPKQCRFCLCTKTTTYNPLINPCNCKGSLEFVHLKCLNRWRQMDMARNGRTCSLCLSIYVFPRMHEFEHILGTDSIALYILHYPGLILATYHYIYVITLASNKNYTDFLFLEFFYLVSQYILHIFYGILFVWKWQVLNRQMYWPQLKTIWTPIILGGHLFLFINLQENQNYILGPILSFYMGIYWKAHQRFLQNINEELLGIDE